VIAAAPRPSPGRPARALYYRTHRRPPAPGPASGARRWPEGLCGGGWAASRIGESWPRGITAGEASAAAGPARQGRPSGGGYGNPGPTARGHYRRAATRSSASTGLVPQRNG